jgi:osmotically-inducible protein OsmY
MQHKYLGIAIAAIAVLMPKSAWGGDREIAQQIISRLNQCRDSGQLKDFTLDMKVDNGVVLFRGNVSQASQKQLVLDATQGVEGIANVVDELSVSAAHGKAPQVPTAAVVKRQLTTPIAVTEPARLVTPASTEPQVAAHQRPSMTLAEALTATAEAVQHGPAGDVTTAAEITTDPQSATIQRTAALESVSDEQELADDRVVSDVIAALQAAKQAGQLRGFGVDVKSHQGVVQLTGRAGSADQRLQILQIAERVPGVSGIREAISIPSSVEDLAVEPPVQTLQPLNPPLQMAPQQGTPARMASAPHGMQAQTAPYRMPGQQGAPMQAMPAGMGFGRGVPVAGQPVPMAPHSPVGAPRYDSPNLPNYAWPGYAAHPNYAALTYPQQYSPSAWPYIGPFYPYPQVPLGWRKVSLEWDDGWWFLDFTDK